MIKPRDEGKGDENQDDISPIKPSPSIAAIDASHSRCDGTDHHSHKAHSISNTKANMTVLEREQLTDNSPVSVGQRAKD